MYKLSKRDPVWLMGLAGIVYSTGFAPFNWWVLALCAVGYLVYQTAQISDWKSAFKLGWLFGFTHHVSELYWLYSPFQIEYGSGLGIPLGILSTLLLSAYLALYIGAVSGGISYLSRFKLSQPVICLLWPLLWVAGEMLRGWLFTGFPWNLAGYVWSDNVYLLQTAAYGKVWLISGWVILLGALLGQYQRRSLIIAVVLLVAIGGYGYLRIAQFEQQRAEVESHIPLNLRLVQPNITQEDKWDVDTKHQQLKYMLQLGLQGDYSSQPDIIILPETAFTFTMNEHLQLLDNIRDNLKPNQTLISGIPSKAWSDKGKFIGYYNSIIALNNYRDNYDTVSDIYHKQLLVPLGEYVPLRWLMPSFIEKLVKGQFDYVSGNRPPQLEVLGGIKLLPLVCFESIFPQYVSAVAEGKDYILILTNDGWFEGTLAKYQHYAMSKLRAVETGLPVIRVANTGISAIIDGLGREKYRMIMGQSNVLNVDIRLVSRISK